MAHPCLVLLSENQQTEGNRQWIQILKSGEFKKDPFYGDFDVTPRMLSEMVNNFKAGIRGIIPAIDYSHESDGPAAGWFKDLETRTAGTTLWANVEWTPRGQKSLADKDFAYLSSDFDEQYIDNETGKNYGCVLKGAALTNRPVIKGMSPAVQLAESKKLAQNPAVGKEIAHLENTGHENKQAIAAALNMEREGKLSEDKSMGSEVAQNGKGDQTPKKDAPAAGDKGQVDPQKYAEMEKKLADYSELAEAHGLSEADMEGVMKKIASAKSGAQEGSAEEESKETPEEEKKEGEGDAPKEDKMAEVKEMKKELSEMRAELAKEKKEKEFMKLFSEGKANASQREAFMSNDMKSFAEKSTLMKTVEQGHGGTEGGEDEENENDAESITRKKAKELCEKNPKMKMVDAIKQVLHGSKKLSEQRVKEQNKKYKEL